MEKNKLPEQYFKWIRLFLCWHGNQKRALTRTTEFLSLDNCAIYTLYMEKEIK